jgi:hypothetical protein
VAAVDCRCDRCQMTVSWMPGVEAPKLPAHWVKQGSRLYCLACRRERASESGVAGLPEGTSLISRKQRRASACIEFEVDRDPDRLDGEVAKACRTSVSVVRKTRRQLAAS